MFYILGKKIPRLAVLKQNVLKYVFFFIHELQIEIENTQPRTPQYHIGYDIGNFKLRSMQCKLK